MGSSVIRVSALSSIKGMHDDNLLRLPRLYRSIRTIAKRARTRKLELTQGLNGSIDGEQCQACNMTERKGKCVTQLGYSF